MTDKDKKKSMKKKSKDMKQGSVLVQLYENRLLSSKVDEALDSGETYDFIIDLCADSGLEISKATLSRYKSKREEAIKTGVPIEELLDLRKKNGNVIDIANRKEDSFGEKKTGNKRFDDTFGTIDKVYNDIQFLDEIIQKSFNGIQMVDVIDAPLGIRALEAKAKITNNSLQGLSLVGLRELKLRVSARTSAMQEVLLKYIPEDQHEQVLADIEAAEQEYYDNLDLTEESKRISDALEKSGIDF